MSSKPVPPFSLPFRELNGTFAKDKYLIINKRYYQQAKTPFSVALERYYLIAFQGTINQALSLIVDKYISIARYSRRVELDEDEQNKYTFFILKLRIAMSPVRYKKCVDEIYESILKKKIDELTITSAVTGIKLLALPYSTIKKIMDHEVLTLKDLQIDEGSTGKYFGRIKDINIFTTSKRLGLVNRPIQAIPEVYSSVVLGTDLRGEHKVGINTQRLLMLGSNFKKNLSLLEVLCQQLAFTGPSAETKTSLPMIILNFREEMLPEQLLAIAQVKVLPIDAVETDPLTLLNSYPQSLQQVTKIMEHILQLLPAQIGVFEGLFSNYVTTCKDVLSLGGFLDSLSSRLHNIPLDNEIDESGVNIAVLESSGLPDRSIESLQYKLSYLRSIIQKTPKKFSLQFIAQKNGSIYLISNPQTSIEEKILAFTLLSENMSHYNPKYTLVLLGLDKFLATIPLSQKDLLKLTYQRYFNTYMTVVEMNEYSRDIEDLLPQTERDIVYTSTINIPKDSYATPAPNLSPRSNRSTTVSLYAQYQEMINVVSTNTDISAVLRHDRPNEFLYFTIGQQTSEEKIPVTPAYTLENTGLELPDSPLAFKILECIKKQPIFVCVPEYIAIIQSEYYYDGLKAIETLEQLKYVFRPSHIYRHIQLTYEAQKFLEIIATYFKRYEPKSWLDLDKKSSATRQEILAGLIASYLPEYNWELIFIYLSYMKQKISQEELMYHVKQIKNMEDKKKHSLDRMPGMKQTNDRDLDKISMYTENVYHSSNRSALEEQLISEISENSMQNPSPLPGIRSEDDQDQDQDMYRS